MMLACLASFVLRLGNQMHVASIFNYEITMQRNVHRSESFCRRLKATGAATPLVQGSGRGLTMAPRIASGVFSVALNVQQ